VKVPGPNLPPFLHTPTNVSPLGHRSVPSPLRKSRTYRPTYDMPFAHTVTAEPHRSSASQVPEYVAPSLQRYTPNPDLLLLLNSPSNELPFVHRITPCRFLKCEQHKEKHSPNKHKNRSPFRGGCCSSNRPHNSRFAKCSGRSCEDRSCRTLPHNMILLAKCT